MIISFTWTTQSLLADQKTGERRIWAEKYFQRWVQTYRNSNLIHAAYAKSPYAKERIGQIKLIGEPYRERLADRSESDRCVEGRHWCDQTKFIELFGATNMRPVVVRYEFVKPQIAQEAQHEAK
jgi:hypothetical protein